MTSSDHNNDFNDFVTAPAQQKLEWVTPKISLMGTENTEGKPLLLTERTTNMGTGTTIKGPS